MGAHGILGRPVRIDPAPVSPLRKDPIVKTRTFASTLIVVTALALVGAVAASAADGTKKTQRSWLRCMVDHGVSTGDPAAALSALPAALDACGRPGTTKIVSFVSCLKRQGFDVAAGRAAAGVGAGDGGRLVQALRACNADIDRLGARVDRFTACMSRHGVTLPTSPSGWLSFGLKLAGDRESVASAWSSCRGTLGKMELPPSLRDSLKPATTRGS
jgi:hypothetical protein